MATVWAVGLPGGDVCATGGYDALVTCWRVHGRVGQPPADRGHDGDALERRRAAERDLRRVRHRPTPTALWRRGPGRSGMARSAQGGSTTHLYPNAGTFTATLTVADDGGASNTTTGAVVVTAAAGPTAPSKLTANALSASSIGLKWTNGTTPQTSVRVERCTGAGCVNFVQAATLPGTATAFTDNGLAPEDGLHVSRTRDQRVG